MCNDDGCGLTIHVQDIHLYTVLSRAYRLSASGTTYMYVVLELL